MSCAYHVDNLDILNPFLGWSPRAITAKKVKANDTEEHRQGELEVVVGKSGSGVLLSH